MTTATCARKPRSQPRRPHTVSSSPRQLLVLAHDGNAHRHKKKGAKSRVPSESTEFVE